MAGCCHDRGCGGAANDPAWRRALWIALAVNAGMFLTEIAAGIAAGSASLQADALDFFGDAANYAISLTVAGLSLRWRASASLVKGATLLAFGAGVLASAGWQARAGTVPGAHVMGAVGVAALLANAAVALMLYRFRNGESNRRSVWICSRNDAVGNVAVLLAALGVFGTGTAWPDIVVAAAMATLALTGGWQILRQASDELGLASGRIVLDAATSVFNRPRSADPRRARGETSSHRAPETASRQ